MVHGTHPTLAQAAAISTTPVGGKNDLTHKNIVASVGWVELRCINQLLENSGFFYTNSTFTL